MAILSFLTWAENYFIWLFNSSICNNIGNKKVNWGCYLILLIGKHVEILYGCFHLSNGLMLLNGWQVGYQWQKICEDFWDTALCPCCMTHPQTTQHLYNCTEVGMLALQKDFQVQFECMLYQIGIPTQLILLSSEVPWPKFQYIHLLEYWDFPSISSTTTYWGVIVDSPRNPELWASQH